MMKNTRTLPSIHIPVQDANGSVGWAWYMFFQWVSENAGSVDLSDYFTKEETEELLSAKSNIDDLSDVAFSGDYDDLSNKPTIPDAQIQSDWNQADNTKVDYIKNKPTIPTVNDATITITQGGTTVGSFTTNQSSDETIALDSGGYYPDLFDWKWADHELDDMSWLRADTFSWQDGTVYSDAYQHLVDEWDSATTESETIDGTSISYRRAADGHKIVPDAYESAVAAIYSSTGVAWYYILDLTNQRFKLPRTQFGVTGYRGSVGNYIAPGLPNITGVISNGDCAAGTYNIGRSGAFYAVNQNSRSMLYDRLNVTNTYGDTGFDASRSNGIYGASTTVQPKATQQYLYFYVGKFGQTAVQQTAGLNAELFNNKVDVGIFNLLYPVGAVYIGIQSVCPLASIIPGSTWQQVQGRYLLASGTIAGTSESASAGAYISAGLPNITGNTGGCVSNGTPRGCFYQSTQVSTAGGGAGRFYENGFDASRSSSIYGNSSTVRPTAYAVNVWVRTA